MQEYDMQEYEMEIIREELHSKLSDIVEIFEPTLRDVEDIGTQIRFLVMTVSPKSK